MTLITQIITEAYRESNNIAVGQTPTAQEQAEGLLLFNRYLSSVYGNEASDPLTPFAIGNHNVSNSTFLTVDVVPTNWWPPHNSRIVFNNNNAQTLYMNPYPEDGERLAINDASKNFSTFPVTIYGNGRLIDGATSVVLNTNGTTKEYFYRGDTNNWMSVLPLALADTFPFPVEFEDMFIIGLAMRINPRNKQDIDPQSIQTYKRLHSLFRARYSQRIEQRPEEGLLRTPGVHGRFFRNYGTYLTPGQRFNLGLSL